MLRAGGDHLIDIGAEGQNLGWPNAGPAEFDGHKRRVLDFDPAALGRGLQEEISTCLAPQDRGKQAHQFLASDWAAAIEPGAIALDDKRQIAAVLRFAVGPWCRARQGYE